MIQAFLSRLWHSPTFTSWGNKIAASARLFLVLPLLLNRFDDVQLAAWLLFGSIMFFSDLVGAQTSLVLSRMVSVASAGAEDLRVISGNSRPSNLGGINWSLLSRLYGSMGLLDLINALFGGGVAIALGWYSLEAVTHGYPGAASIWCAFLLFIGGKFIGQIFRRYSVTLRGLNQVALTNRWEALFALFSAISGGVTLWLGGSIIQLALVMQLFILAGVVRQWALLMYVVEPRFRSVPFLRFDRQIIQWVWSPLWRSFIRAVANRGSAKVGVIVLARNTEPVVLSSILLSLRLLDTLEDIAVTPMSSHVPNFGRLLAQGKVAKFRSGVYRAFRLSCLIQSCGIVAIAYVSYCALDLINSDSRLLSQSVFLTLALAHLLASQVRQSLIITVIGNDIIAVPRLLLAAALSVVLAVLLIPSYPILGFIVSSFMPVVLILNIYPIRCGCELMGMSTQVFICRTVSISWLCIVSALVVSLLLPWELWSLQFSNYIRSVW